VRRRQPDVSGSPEPVEVETLVGACMAFHLTLAETAGQLDEDFFFYFEEIEWCVRLRRQGWQVLINFRVRATYIKGVSTRAIQRDAQVEMLRSRLLYYWKTMPPILAIPLSVWRVLRLSMNTVSYLLLGVLTLGLLRKVRTKLMVYLTQLTWLIISCRASWGLSDKCSRQA